LKQAPQTAAVHTVLGEIYMTRRDTTAARRSFQRALQLDRDDLEALTNVVTLEVQANHFNEARRLVDARLAKSPNDPGLLALAARTYATAGDLPKAEQLLKRVIASDSSNFSAYGMLGQLYMSQERLEAARLEYERVVARDPKSIAAHTIIAMILEAQHKTDEAQRRYERILEIDPNAVVAANNLAWLHVQRNQHLDLALELAQRAKQQLSSDPRVNDTLGWVYYQKNLTDQAIPFLLEGVTRDAGNPLHHYHLGMAYVRLGDWPRARQALERALMLKPDFAGADQAKKALVMMGG